MDRVITVQSFDPQQGVIFEVLVDDNGDVSVAKQLRRAFHFLTGRAACLWQQSHDIECGSILDLHWSPSYWETVIGILRPASRATAQPAAGFFLGYSARRSAATSDGCAPAAATCLTPDIDSAHLASTGAPVLGLQGKTRKLSTPCGQGAYGLALCPCGMAGERKVITLPYNDGGELRKLRHLGGAIGSRTSHTR